MTQSATATVRHGPVVLAWAAVLGALLSLLLMAARASSAISFAVPLQLITSGDEQSSLFAVWKASHGLPIYVDRLAPPFAHAFFNWLFYQSYGGVAAAVRAALGLDDAWLPTVGRLFTLVGVAAAAGLAYLAFERALRPSTGERPPLRTLLAGCLAVYVAAGPLVGFWGLTVRPDVWSLALETAAVAIFLALYPARRLPAVLGAAAAAYLAWSFKQTAVFAAAGIGLFLLLRRDWPMLAALVATMVAAWAITLLLGGSRYAAAIFFVGVPLEYSAAHTARIAVNFAVKALPALLMATAVLAALTTGKTAWIRLWASDAFLLGACGLFAAALLVVPSTTQTAGSENYYFPLNFFLSLAGAAGLAIAFEERPREAARLSAFVAAGWIGLAAAVAAVFAGMAGVIDVRGQHANHMALKRCLDGLPRPLFVYDRYLSLPWMTPGNEPFVLSYVYETERARGRPFVDGGIGGMIEAGRFQAVAIPGTEPVSSLDHASLANYGPGPRRCAGMTVLYKKST